MTLNDLISEIRELRPDWEERYAIHLINTKRAQFLKNRLNQGWKINDVVTQTLPDVAMRIATNSELETFHSQERILKSMEPIPSLVARHNKHAFMAVRNPNVLTADFNVVSREQAFDAGHGRFNQRQIFVFLYKGYLYIKLPETNPKAALITTVSLEGIFEDPLEAQAFNNPELDGRDFWWEEYPLNAADWNYVKNLILGSNEEIPA